MKRYISSLRIISLLSRQKHYFLSYLLALSFTLLLSHVAAAQDITITATVPAPLPSGSPVITAPLDQQHLSSSHITVEGTCEPHTAYLVIMRNDIAAASTPCISGQFTTQLFLLASSNSLLARSFSFTDDEGPSSITITVYYDVPLPPTPESPLLPSSTQPPAVFTPKPLPSLITPTIPSAVPPFFITSHPSYAFKEPHEMWRWQFLIHGGIGPYHAKIVWGDGATNEYLPDGNGMIIATHSYQRSGTFAPVITAFDSRGAETSFHFFAIVKATSPTATPAAPPLAAVSILIVLLFIFALFDIELFVQTIVQLFSPHKK